MISLSLCMIVKNEEAVLERILKPVSQVMDAILIAGYRFFRQNKRDCGAVYVAGV